MSGLSLVYEDNFVLNINSATEEKSFTRTHVSIRGISDSCHHSDVIIANLNPSAHDSP
jgi:hypothetical protein